MIDARRLTAAAERARDDLLAERVAGGHWVGQLSSSALSTATAVSALALAGSSDAAQGEPIGSTARTGPDSGLVSRGVGWLLLQQNGDGGWGDTDRSYSNIATTMLVAAALRLADASADHGEPLRRAEGYVRRQGGVEGVRLRYGRDKTFAVPILMTAALAGMVPWREVSPLPFELACVPQHWYRWLRLPVVSYAIPALVAVGQARYFHGRPLNPLVRAVRAAAVSPSLRVLEQVQPDSGGYLEAIPLTSFVVISLAATGRARHPVAMRGCEFLRASVRADGSWPIDTNLATWNTSLARSALAAWPAAGGRPGMHDSLDWLLECQHRRWHRYTGAAPGGWGWSDLSGAVPDADDTAAALLALAHAWRGLADARRPAVQRAAREGAKWLLDLQNSDGGWPTFCRGWGRLPFDRSGNDLTAHALRALYAWRELLQDRGRVSAAIRRGLRFLESHQGAGGSWVPLWFGNQDDPREENPVYGTARVLLAYRDLGLLDSPAAHRGRQWLERTQNADGGWGSAGRTDPHRDVTSSVEETALAVEALLGASRGAGPSATRQGLDWLVRAVEDGRHGQAAPIGFYFARLWYHERLYPLIFTVSALGQAVRTLLAPTGPDPAHLAT